MKKISLVLKLSALLFLSLSTTVQSQWSFLIYADPAAEITEAVIKNLNDLVQSYNSLEVQVYVQLRVFISQDASKSHAWRYRAHDNCLQFVEAIEMTEDFYTDVTSAMAWAYGQADVTTTNFGLLFSGHGCGILEPESTATSGSLGVEHDDAQCLTCNRHFVHMPKKSILLNEFTGKAMDNSTMLNIMNFGTTLIGSKFDFVGFDLCLGAMLEHAYQLVPYVQFLVGYQYCAAVEGFDYFALGKQLQKADCSPESLARHMVQSHESYSMKLAPHHKHTLSALDCSAAVSVVVALDAFALFCMNLISQNSQLVDEIMTVRKDCYHACWVPMYTDLYQVVTQIGTNIAPFLTIDEQVALQALITDVQNQIDNLVLEKFTSENLSHLHGINIYFPYSHIDRSYYRAPFAQSSMWVKFLEMVINEDN